MTRIKNGFIIQPYHELLPDYKICPFSNNDISKNRNFKTDLTIDEYFASTFKKRKWKYTVNGREALSLALKTLNLSSTDIISIVTTSDNFYISSCVTNEINKFCCWNRTIDKKTKVILVNHEFGFPYQRLAEIQKYKLPIIEDCAHSFFSLDENNLISKFGDYVIFSFPKMFPIQTGGLLVTKEVSKFSEESQASKELLEYNKNVLSYYISKKDKIIEKRKENYLFLKNHFEELGYPARFEMKRGSVPGVFMFRLDNPIIDLPELKKYFYAHGIQCSIFYGERTFFLPCHQNLKESDLVYFIEVFKSFIN